MTAPLLGAGLGAAMAGIWWLAGLLWPGGVAAGFALLAGLLLGRARQETGFARLCDGLGGGRTRERALEILRDTRLGAFGATGLVLLLGLRWQALAGLPPALLPGAVIAAGALSRGGVAAIAGDLAPRQRAGTATLAIAPLALLPPAAWIVCLAAAVAVLGGCLPWFRRRLGTCTAEGRDAAQQLAELAVLLAALALA